MPSISNFHTFLFATRAAWAACTIIKSMPLKRGIFIIVLASFLCLDCCQKQDLDRMHLYDLEIIIELAYLCAISRTFRWIITDGKRFCKLSTLMHSTTLNSVTCDVNDDNFPEKKTLALFTNSLFPELQVFFHLFVCWLACWVSCWFDTPLIYIFKSSLWLRRKLWST